MSRKTLRNKGKKRAVLPSYAIDDFVTQQALILARVSPVLVGKALAALARRIAKHRGENLWQRPHQGAQECARRIRQGVAK